MMWLKEHSFISNIPDWWHEPSVSGWMGFQLAQKPKYLKVKINI